MKVTELFNLKGEIRNAINHLDEWMGPEYVKRDIVNVINTLWIKREPLGVVCVFSTWNYPVILLLQPVATAIAAGVCVCVCVCVCMCVYICMNMCVCVCVCRCVGCMCSNYTFVSATTHGPVRCINLYAFVYYSTVQAMLYY